MAEEFNAELRRFFGASHGTYSKVTQDEFDHSQVTFTGPEQALAERYFGSQLDDRHGNRDEIEARGLDPTLPYRLYPGGEEIRLTTSYKKNKPNELRYYLRKDAFKPAAGNFWGLFVRDDALWVCEFSQRLLDQIQAGVFEDKQRNDILDPDEGVYQDDSNDPPSKTKSVVDKWNRRAAVSNEALVSHGFTCEIRPEWPTFVNRKTGQPYMEAHHLIPMSLQGQIQTTLDVPQNVCCLNPLAHRMLHHAPFNDIEDDLVSLIRKRDGLLAHFGLLERDVLGMYDR
jgi:hypothetical protein